MRLRSRVMILSLAVSMLLAVGLAYAVLQNSFHNSLLSELDRGVSNSGMLAASLASGIEAFSHLSQADASQRAVRLTASYMTEPALITVTSPGGLLLHDNFPLDTAALLRFIPMEAGQYRLVSFGGQPWQLIRRLLPTSQGQFELVYARSLDAIYQAAHSQTVQAVLLLLALGLALVLLLFVSLRAVFAPLAQLENAAHSIAGGQFEARAQVVHPGDEVGKLAQSFNHMAAATQQHILALHQRDQAQQQFIADMAHELKTPLTSMIGYADLLRRQHLTQDQQQQALASVVSQGERLERMGSKLLHLARLDGGLPQQMQPQDARALLLEAKAAMQPLAEEQGIRLLVRPGDASLVCDRDLMLTLLQNLLANALCASLPRQAITLAASPAGLCVQDEGHGIPAQHLPHVTEAFYMADAARSRARQSAGLGLALARRIAALHGAQLVILSQLGQGTAVCLLFGEEKSDESVVFTSP